MHSYRFQVVPFPQVSLQTSLLSPHTCYMPRPIHSPWFDHPYNIWWAIEIIKLLILQSSPFYCKLPPLNKNSWRADHETPHHSGFSTPFLSPSLTRKYLECRSWRSSTCSLLQFNLISLPYTKIPGFHNMNPLLCSFLHSPLSSSLLGPNILLNTLFSNTLRYIPPSMSATKFHTHTKQQATL